MTGTDAIREIAQTVREYVQTGMLSASVTPCQGWTIAGTARGVVFATPDGPIRLSDGWIDGDDSAASPELAGVLGRVEVIQ